MLKRLMSLVLMLSISMGFFSVYPQPAQAFVAATGSFKANTNCPAPSSIRKKTNPGNVRISPEVSYPLLGKNKQEATHYQIQIEGASPVARWVEVSCGTIDTSVASVPSNQDYVFAASWQPSFCETKPNKPECTSQTEDRFDATSFSIHGLWPHPQYCNVSRNIQELDKKGRWLELPALELSPALRQELAIKMPGYQSGLHRHEWYKHGTCYSPTPEEYYEETISLLDQLNGSEVRKLMAQNLEQNITEEQINQAFGNAFGVTGKVSMSCERVNGERLIDELLIKLRGEIEPETDLGDLLAAASNARGECPIGQVDSVDD